MCLTAAFLPFLSGAMCLTEALPCVWLSANSQPANGSTAITTSFTFDGHRQLTLPSLQDPQQTLHASDTASRPSFGMIPANAPSLQHPWQGMLGDEWWPYAVTRPKKATLMVEKLCICTVALGLCLQLLGSAGHMMVSPDSL